MNKAEIRALLIRIGACIVSGVILWILLCRNTVASSQNIIPDLLFSVGSVMLIAGIVGFLNDIHTFTSASHSFRIFHQVFRGHQRSTEEYMEELRNRESVKKHSQCALYFIIAVIFILLSVILSIL